MEYTFTVDNLDIKHTVVVRQDEITGLWIIDTSNIEASGVLYGYEYPDTSTLYALIAGTQQLNTVLTQMLCTDYTAIINDLQTTPPEPDIYTENGFLDRADYLQGLADDFGLQLSTVVELANFLGQDEDFDGLVSSLQDTSY